MSPVITAPPLSTIMVMRLLLGGSMIVGITLLLYTLGSCACKLAKCKFDTLKAFGIGSIVLAILTYVIAMAYLLGWAALT